MSRPYRWYILARQAGGTYRIAGWSRTKEGAAARRTPDGFCVFAGSREQAARRARNWWGLEVDWRKFEAKPRRTPG